MCENHGRNLILAKVKVEENVKRSMEASNNNHVPHGKSSSSFCHNMVATTESHRKHECYQKPKSGQHGRKKEVPLPLLDALLEKAGRPFSASASRPRAVPPT